MTLNASCAHRTEENEKNGNNKMSVQTLSICAKTKLSDSFKSHVLDFSTDMFLYFIITL